MYSDSTWPYKLNMRDNVIKYTLSKAGTLSLTIHLIYNITMQNIARSTLFALKVDKKNISDETWSKYCYNDLIRYL